MNLIGHDIIVSVGREPDTLPSGVGDDVIYGEVRGYARRRRLGPGQPDRHIIAKRIVDGREHALHATKGWRIRRPS